LAHHVVVTDAARSICRSPIAAVVGHVATFPLITNGSDDALPTWAAHVRAPGFPGVFDRKHRAAYRAYRSATDINRDFDALKCPKTATISTNCSTQPLEA
jgi:hypothetical protein